MAAISGILQWGNSSDAADVAMSLQRRLAHRAPDGTRSHAEPGITLAHGALHATPESRLERQPLTVAGRWVIVVDGRIDDRPSLMRRLGLDAGCGDTTTDAALFAGAWARWGVEFWRHVTGDFALAAWDSSASQLHLVRDRVGVRPLYYARTATSLAFASEQEALLAVPGVSSEFDDDRIAYYLAPAFVDDDPGATWFRDVRRVQPGERLTATAGGAVTLTRYWRMAPREASSYRDPGECVEAFREVFDEAVRCRLRSPSTPGLMLSGGIDSASILAAALRLDRDGRGTLPRPVSFTLEPGSDNEESRNIDSMLARCADPVHFVLADYASTPAFAQFAREFWDEADGWNGAVLPKLAYSAASDAGIRVMLDGIDGDLVMLSPDNLAARLAASGDLRGGWRLAKASALHHTYLQGRHPAHILGRGLAQLAQPQWLRGFRIRLHALRQPEHFLGPEINGEFACRLRLPQRWSRLAVDAARAQSAGWQQRLLHAWWGPGLTRAMEGFDAMAARRGVEPRHPWADLRVIEFFLRLPPVLGALEGWTKYPARKASAPELGHRVAWHAGKDHFGHLALDAVLTSTWQRVARLLAGQEPWMDQRISPDHAWRVRDEWLNRRGERNYEVQNLATLAAWRARIHQSGA